MVLACEQAPGGEDEKKFGERSTPTSAKLKNSESEAFRAFPRCVHVYREPVSRLMLFGLLSSQRVSTYSCKTLESCYLTQRKMAGNHGIFSTVNVKKIAKYSGNRKT